MARRRGPGGRGASPRVRALLSCLLVLVAAQALFAGLATLAAALPREPIETNLAASADDARQAALGGQLRHGARARLLGLGDRPHGRGGRRVAGPGNP